ncbi:cellulose binding domain-containing protein [Streptomyces sp. HMX87]|uniref:cellulose binding domain-containing protein n=1 Tax=Streptomyces sp. HMX87 TaxID=3390849 RepID=UPI003A884DF9
MPDLPIPEDAAEAAQFAECRDAVLSYADLCAAGPEAAARLATEAFTRGMREVRTAAGPAGPTARRPARLPRIPLLLTAVRTTAAAWESAGRGDGLAPGLRLWLHSDQAARHTGPPPRRPLALRGLRDMQAPDAELLWLADVEALPPVVVARRLGLDPATLSEELAQVRELFRDRCRQSHRDAPLEPRCRGYARLLDAVSRSPVAGVPDDLARHLAICADCAEAAACLRADGAGLPAALAGGVIGWGGLTYLERRRRAADARLGAGQPAPADDIPADDGAPRAGVVRGGLLATAVLVSLLALGASLMPLGGRSGEDTVGSRPVADPVPSLPSAPSPSTRPPSDAPSPSRGTPRPDATRPAAQRKDRPPDPDPEPQGTVSSTAARPTAGHAGPPVCRVDYDLVNQWPDGFQATVTVTTTSALDSWRVAWSFPDGQQVRHMWDASYEQDGSRVTAGAAAYNGSVPAGGRLSFGLIASRSGENSPPRHFTLNGQDCA